MPSCYTRGQIYTTDGKSLYDLSQYGFADLNISEVFLSEGKNELWNYNLPAVITAEQSESRTCHEIINMFINFMQKLL